MFTFDNIFILWKFKHIFFGFQVAKVLNQYLSEDEYADYDHFIKMKAKLIMDAREIDDKIKLGEEQQQALVETMCCKNPWRSGLHVAEVFLWCELH